MPSNGFSSLFLVRLPSLALRALSDFTLFVPAPYTLLPDLVGGKACDILLKISTRA